MNVIDNRKKPARKRLLALWLLVCAHVSAQQISIPAELSGRPFFIAKTWVIDREGEWDHLTADSKAGQLDMLASEDPSHSGNTPGD
jgi:hypothetical protein